MHVYSFAAVARCDALRFLSVYTMDLWCAFELLCSTQDRLHAGFTVSSWSWMKSTLLQNKMGPRSYDAAMAFFLLIFPAAVLSLFCVFFDAAMMISMISPKRSQIISLKSLSYRL